MLTDEQLRNGMTSLASRWPNNEVPFVIDDVFSEYCSTKLKRGLPLSQHGRQTEASYATELQWVGQDKRNTVSCEVVHWVEVVKDRGQGRTEGTLRDNGSYIL
jgi:hypothetical protein